MVMSTINGAITRVKEVRKWGEVREGRRGHDPVKAGLIRRVCSKAREVGGGRHGATTGKRWQRARPVQGRTKEKGGRWAGWPARLARGNGLDGQWAGDEKRN
jgi:hypothetical protein